MLEMKIVLRTVVLERELEAVQPHFTPPRRRNITIAPADGCLVRMPARHTPHEAVDGASTLALSAAGG